MKIMQKDLKRLIKAFTLSELLLAALILAFVFGTLIVSFVSCFLLNEANRNLAIATTHAQYVMEEIKDTASTTSGFTTVRNNGNSQWDWSGTNITSKGLTALDNESINTSTSDAVINGTTVTTLLDVSVTVSWRDRARDRSMTLETLISEP